jgi:UDP-N-acetylmuramoyl-tripeptide--D-alanyl-D-alanine ligase
MEFTVREIAVATGGRVLRGAGDAQAGTIATDTRSLRQGEAFLALRGPRFDGHDFAADAAAAGASCLVLDRADAAARARGPAVVLVRETGPALLDLGRAARARLACPVIAVTGSCGKTTAKEMIGQVLARHRRGRRPPKSFNNQVGVPLALLAAEPDDEFVVLELGTNAPGEIAALAEVARPTIGVVMLVAPVHLEGLGSIEGVAREKAALVEAVPADGVAVLNADDARVAAMAGRSRGRVVTFGVEREAAFRARDLVVTEQGTRFSVGEVGFSVPVLGAHQALAALAAAAVAREFGVSVEETAEALRDFEPPAMRLALCRAGDVLVVNDAYNANPESMRAALALLALWPERRKVFFCGDMLELGPAARPLHEALGRQAVEAGVTRLVGVGPLAEATARAARAAGLKAEAVTRAADASSAAAEARTIVRPGDVVLVKGSRAVGMERVVAALAAPGKPVGPAGGSHRAQPMNRRGR